MTQSGANSDDEASDLYVLREYPGKFNGKNNDVILAGRYGFLAGITHARRTQAAEIYKLVELLKCFVEDNECSLDHHGGCQEHMFLSLDHDEICPNKEARILIRKYANLTSNAASEGGRGNEDNVFKTR